MSASRATNWALATFAALGINCLLFILPLIMAVPHIEKAVPEIEGGVRLSSLKTPRPQKEEVQQNQPEQMETPERFIQPVLETPVPVTQPKVDIDLPPAEFEINPQLSQGVAVNVAAVKPAAHAPALAGGSFGVGDLDDRPMLIFGPTPQYPLQARRRGLRGTVKARLSVNEKGQVTAVKIVGGDNVKIFADAVRSTLVRWRFSPGKKDGKPVRWAVIVPIAFDRD